MIAICSEYRVPEMTEASMSCPIRSVPNGWAAPGATLASPPASRPSGHSTGPRNANATRRRKRIIPASAARCRTNRRATVCHCLRASAPANPAASDEGAVATADKSVKADPRVEAGVEHVGHQVEQDDEDGRDHHPALQDRK